MPRSTRGSDIENAERSELNHAMILKTCKDFELADTKSPAFSITRINSGAVNKNYKIADGTKTFLLKIFSTKTVLPINRRAVFSMQEELAILGLAPAPLFLNDECTIYCEQWIETPAQEHAVQTYNESHKVQTSKVEILAEVLYNVHTSFVSSQLLALDQHWQVYWQKVDSPSKALCQQYDMLTLQWQAHVKQNIGEFVLCHNDLHIDHVSYPHGPVFDWEYAGLCCRFFDIANCCAINTLSQDDINKLCYHYARLSDQNVHEVLDKVQKMSVMSAFTAQLWSASLGIVGKAQ